MEYLEGETLHARMQREPISWPEARSLIAQVVRALDATHDNGFTHRDLKPENIWLQPRGDGGVQVKLLDFGLAKLMDARAMEDRLTSAGMMLGTPHYMSPEQIDGVDIDHRSDIYSLGVILYEMFSGHRPFGGDTFRAVISGHLFQPPPPIARLPDGAPPTIVEIIHLALAKDPQWRYHSARDLLADVRDVAAGRQPTIARSRMPTAAPAHRALAPSRARWLLDPRVVGLASVLLGFAVTVAIAPGDRSAARPADAAPAASLAERTLDDDADDIDHEATRREARDRVLAALDHRAPAVRIEGWRALSAIHDADAAHEHRGALVSDADPDVRSHIALALGDLGVREASDALVALYRSTADATRVRFARALSRLGHGEAHTWLLELTESDAPRIAFEASKTLSEESDLGDREVIAALTRVASKRDVTRELPPSAGMQFLGALARLGHEQARTALRDSLDHEDEPIRLEAARALAAIGDDTSRDTLEALLRHGSLPARVEAATSLIDLGDYSGYSVLLRQLAHEDPAVRRRCVEGLGELAEPDSLPRLLQMYNDPDRAVQVSAAAVVFTIASLDPRFLADSSADWAADGMNSQDRRMRAAVAGLLGDLREDDAVGLLAQAVQDPDPEVRRVAAQSVAGRNSPRLVRTLMSAVQTETDRRVRAQQIASLGEMGDASARGVLSRIAREKTESGVLALGALARLGDANAALTLQDFYHDTQTSIRKALMSAARLANDDALVGTLERGLADSVFEVRFEAALGLAAYRKDLARAREVLREGAERSPAVRALAQAALVRVGAATNAADTVADMVSSIDPETRAAAIPILVAMRWDEARPWIQRLIADSVAAVRRAAVAAIDAFGAHNRDDATRMYKRLLRDRDPVVRARAQTQLVKHVKAQRAAKRAAREAAKQAAREAAKRAETDAASESPTEPKIEPDGEPKIEPDGASQNQPPAEPVEIKSESDPAREAPSAPDSKRQPAVDPPSGENAPSSQTQTGPSRMDVSKPGGRRPRKPTTPTADDTQEPNSQTDTNSTLQHLSAKDRLRDAFENGQLGDVLRWCPTVAKNRFRDQQINALCAIAACKLNRVKEARKYYSFAYRRFRINIAQQCMTHGINIQRK
jgi:HEAT repeat protein